MAPAATPTPVIIAASAATCPRVIRSPLQCRIDSLLLNDRIEPAEPIDSSDPADPRHRIEPAEPIERIEPAEPIEAIEPAEPTPLIEPTDESDRIENADAAERNEWYDTRGTLVPWPATSALLRAESNAPLARRGDEGTVVRTFEDAGTKTAVRWAGERGKRWWTRRWINRPC